MAATRCPNCQALNAADAQECSLCGEVFTTEAEVEPEPKALPGSRANEIVPRTETPAAVEAGPRDARFAVASEMRRGALVVKTAAIGAAVATSLVIVAYVLLSAVGHLPLIGRIGLLYPLASPGEAAGVLTAVPEAVVLGAIAGGLAAFRDTPRLGAVVVGVLAAVLRAITLLGGTLAADYGSFGVAYGVVLVGADGVFGGFCGYMASLVVCGYLAAAGQRPSD